MAGKDGSTVPMDAVRIKSLTVASHIYICLKPLINLSIADCLLFLHRDALRLVFWTHLQT